MQYLTQRIRRLFVAVFLGWLSLTASSVALADVDCDQSAKVFSRYSLTLPSNDAENRQRVDQLIKDSAPKLRLDCVCLMEQRELATAQGIFDGKRDWRPFAALDPTLSQDEEFLYDECRKSSCRYTKAIQDFLEPTCRKLRRSDRECKGLKDRKPIEKWQLGLGIPLVVGGAIMAILGAVHMGVPLFKTQGGCTAFGFDHPCVADRYGTGGPLLGIGLLATAGGAVTLAVRF